MAKHFVGIVEALGGLLAGAWLTLAPSALAYQPVGAGWTDPTLTDFWTGLEPVALLIFGMLMYSLGVVEELYNRGIIQRCPAHEESRYAAPEAVHLRGGYLCA